MTSKGNPPQFPSLVHQPFLPLIVSHALTAWGDRMWAFAVPLLLLKVFPDSLLLPAVHAFAVQTFVFLLSPSIGDAVDRLHRLRVVRWSFASANIGAAISSLFLLLLLVEFEGRGQAEVIRESSFWILFALVIVFGIVSELGSAGSNLAVLKNWVIVVVDSVCAPVAAPQPAVSAGESEEMETLVNADSAAEDPEADQAADEEGTADIAVEPVELESVSDAKLVPADVLSRLNAAMRRIDLSCDTLAPMTFSVLLVYASSVACVVFVLLWNLISLPFEYGLLSVVYKNVPALAKEVPPSASGKRHPLVILVHGIRQYVHEPVFLASFSIVCLYLTALSPGVLLTAYLSAIGTSPFAIAFFRGASAAFGIVGTLIYPRLTKKIGLVRSGHLSIVLFCLLVAVASSAVIMSSLASAESVGTGAVLMGAVIVSRAFLWSFDLCETQIMQTQVEASRRGLISGVEKCIAQLFWMMSFPPAIIFSDPSDFYVLCLISITAVASGTVCFSWYARRNKIIPAP